MISVRIQVHIAGLVILGASAMMSVRGQQKEAISPILAGSGTSKENALQKSDLVIVAQLDKLSRPSRDTLDKYGYHAAVTVSKIFKGTTKQKEIRFDFNVLIRDESSPESGQSYIFYLKAGPQGDYDFVKMLPVTESNVSEITKLLEIAPATKPKLP